MRNKMKLIGITSALSAILTLGGAHYAPSMSTKSICVQAQTAAQTSKQVNDTESIKIHGKAAYLMDYTSGNVMYAHNEKLHLPIASMCKIMTLLVTFDAIAAGQLQLSDEICVSPNAAGMGGSQVFLEANAKYPVHELIKSVVVCSANDSCVALAEHISGSEELFTANMNARAKQLGASDTVFANCTGLPKEPQYSCAKDVAIMLKELLKHEEYLQFSRVWMDKFQHPKGRYTEISNTNKLVRFYDGCDGGKTGFTNQAGFCLAATAKRDNMRVISVLIGGDSSQHRFDGVRAMFDYAFANYQMKIVAKANETLEQTIDVYRGKSKAMPVCPLREAMVLTKKGERPNVNVEIDCKPLQAPIQAGTIVGEMIVFKDNVEADRVPLVAVETIEQANWFDQLRDIARLWN